MSDRVQERRRRKQIGRDDGPCGLCGGAEVVLMESRTVRRGLSLVNPAWRAAVRRYTQCQTCGGRVTVMDDRWT